MKKVIPFLVLLIIVSAILVASNVHQLNSYKNDTDFATEVSLRYYYGDREKIDLTLTQGEDFKELKELIANCELRPQMASPACPFSSDIYIKFSDGQRELTLLIAGDGCDVFWDKDSDRYLYFPSDNSERFHEIIEKYGMYFN